MIEDKLNSKIFFAFFKNLMKIINLQPENKL